MGQDSLSFQVTDSLLTSLVAQVTLEVVPPQDTNQNQLPDSWEALHETVRPAKPTTTMMVIPTCMNTWLALTRVTRIPVSESTSFTGNHTSGFTLGWPSIGGVRYRVLVSGTPCRGPGFPTNLTPIVRSAAEETDLSPPGTPSTRQFFDDFSRTGVPSGQARYYRLQIVQ